MAKKGGGGGGRKPKLGTGKRFSNLSRSLGRKGVRDPGALAASIGRKKYGNARFQKMAATGRKRAAARRKR